MIRGVVAERAEHATHNVTGPVVGNGRNTSSSQPRPFPVSTLVDPLRSDLRGFNWPGIREEKITDLASRKTRPMLG